MIELNNNFEANNFALDTLWLDIGYTYDSRYFEFDEVNFNKTSL